MCFINTYLWQFTANYVQVSGINVNYNCANENAEIKF